MNNQIKEEGLTDAYLLGKYDGIKQGRADAESEHKEMCESCIHKVSVEDIEQIRADAIDEYKKKIEFEYKWLLVCKVFDSNVDIAFKTLISYAEQLKDMKNG